MTGYSNEPKCKPHDFDVDEILANLKPKRTYTQCGAARHFGSARLFLTNKDFVCVWFGYLDANRDYILRGTRITKHKSTATRTLFIIRSLDGY